MDDDTYRFWSFAVAFVVVVVLVAATLFEGARLLIATGKAEAEAFSAHVAQVVTTREAAVRPADALATTSPPLPRERPTVEHQAERHQQRARPRWREARCACCACWPYRPVWKLHYLPCWGGVGDCRWGGRYSTF
jgi:hypothetical protein